MVDTEITPHEVIHRHELMMDNGYPRTILFRCQQHKHTVKYKAWYLPTRIYYTYSVEMIRIDSDKYTDHQCGHYPELCVRWLRRSEYPYYCAISAHLDALNKYNQPRQNNT